MMDFYEFNLYAKGLKIYGKTIFRKEWIKNWRTIVVWEDYWDCQIFDVIDAVSDYCEKNKIPFCVDGGWFYCISNRYVYNEIKKLITLKLNLNEEDEL